MLWATRQACACNVTMRRDRVTNIYITYSECVPVALVSRHAKRLRRVVSSVTPVPHYLIKGTIFGGGGGGGDYWI